jgi:hypothetical protein
MHGSKRQPMISSVPKFWQHLIANDADDPLTGRCGRFGLADWNKKTAQRKFLRGLELHRCHHNRAAAQNFSCTRSRQHAAR